MTDIFIPIVMSPQSLKYSVALIKIIFNDIRLNPKWNNPVEVKQIIALLLPQPHACDEWIYIYIMMLFKLKRCVSTLSNKCSTYFLIELS